MRYQVHRPEPNTDIDDTLSALTDLVRAGKVRYLGSSTFPAEDIVEAQWTAERRGRERFRVEQPPYSIFARGAEASVLPTCQRYGMAVISWSPLNGGFLSGRHRPDAETRGPARCRGGPPRRRHPRPHRRPRPTGDVDQPVGLQLGAARGPGRVATPPPLRRPLM
jgi:aryl-alcohol dehydrogenase-like predicted oxidoreductase